MREGRAAHRASASAPARASAGTSTTTTCSTARSASSAPATSAHLAAEWMPALDGVEDKLRGGRARRRHRVRPRRLDDPDGPGLPRLERSSAPTTTRPRSRPRAAPPSAPASPTACASRSRRRDAFAGGPYDLACMFDALHDMGDPVGAARHVRSAAAPRRHLDGGRAVSPATRSRTTSTRSGAIFYAASTTLCTPGVAVAGRSASRSAPRRARRGSPTCSARGASRACAGRRRRRSTSCWRRVRSGERGERRHRRLHVARSSSRCVVLRPRARAPRRRRSVPPSSSCAEPPAEHEIADQAGDPSPRPSRRRCAAPGPSGSRGSPRAST